MRIPALRLQGRPRYAEAPLNPIRFLHLVLGQIVYILWYIYPFQTHTLASGRESSARRASLESRPIAAGWWRTAGIRPGNVGSNAAAPARERHGTGEPTAQRAATTAHGSDPEPDRTTGAGVGLAGRPGTRHARASMYDERGRERMDELSKVATPADCRVHSAA